MLKWDRAGSEFYQDGSSRDVYVLGTRLVHWQRALDALRASGLRMQYFREGVEAPLPSSAAEAFPEPDGADRLLSVDLCGPIANAHFFTELQIEFDLDPSEVCSQRELDSVLRFMQILADATGLETILTPENQDDIPIFRVRPNDSHVEHTSFGGYR